MVQNRPVPEGFVERPGVTSGRIFKEGGAEFAAIFTISDAPAEGEFDVNDLPGLFISAANAEVTSRLQFFEILGGYFFNDADGGTTTNVFGVAADPEFGLANGGAKTLKEDWTLDVEPPHNSLNEEGSGSGWTFIGVYKERSGFPHSSEPLKLTLFCPGVISVGFEIGECEAVGDPPQQKQKVTFSAELDNDAEPATWEWQFGDGESASGNGAPPSTVDHHYAKPPESNPKFTVTSSDGRCAADSKEIEASEFAGIGCLNCPVLDEIRVTYGDCQDDDGVQKRKVTFGFGFSGDDPTSWTFDFGDGQTTSGNGASPASLEHLYNEKPEQAPKLCVSGPEGCEESCVEADLSGFSPCEDCPTINAITSQEMPRAAGAERAAFEFKAETTGGPPNRYEWKFGDGALATTTSETVTHEYALPKKGSATYEVTAESQGPGDCAASTKKTQVSVSAPIVPMMCRLLPLLVALLGGLTFSALVVTFGGDSKLAWFFVFGVLTGVAAYFWRTIGERHGCPPDNCGWQGVLWVVLITGGVLAMIISGCCGFSWWVLIVAILGVGGYLALQWSKNCCQTKTSLILHALTCIVAVILAMLFLVS